jgi:hypothetical protein
MTKEINLSLLKEPFPAEDIEWREQRNGVDRQGRPWAMVLAYVTNRAIMNRLDDVCGPENWRNEFSQSPNGGVLCCIYIRINGEWVGKWDGADNTDIEQVKGGLSGAMKRAAVQWGIGRYLYNLDATFAQVADSGAHRGIAYANDADRKARKNPVYFKWNPPALPDWALPKTKQEATTQDAESQDKKNKAPEPITGKDWNELQDLLKNIPMAPAEFLKAWKVDSPRQLVKNMMKEYKTWISRKADDKAAA